MKTYLITTSLEEFWPKDIDFNVIFLGEWCKLYSRSHIWKGINHQTASYHWNDREKLLKDYSYIQDLYEAFLPILSEKLNNIHHVSHSNDYWRVIIGPWLSMFIQVCFDRWSCIKIAEKKYNIQGSYIDNRYSKLAANNMSDFVNQAINDEWNCIISSYILEKYSEIDVNISTADSNVQVPKKTTTLKILLYKLYQIFFSIFKRKYFFINSGLPLLADFILQAKLGQIPIISKSHSVRVKTKIREREWSLNVDTMCGFEDFLKEVIPLGVPTSYVEDYKYYSNEVRTSYWPDSPRVIWTSISHFSDDVFKIWLARMIEKKTNLIIYQHGGCYGMTRFALDVEHEYKISNTWCSWGWSDQYQKNIRPLGLLSKYKKNNNFFNKKKVLVILTTFPRYQYLAESKIISSQFLDYLDGVSIFLGKVSENILHNTHIRAQDLGYKWDELSRINSQNNYCYHQCTKKNIIKAMKTSKIVIITYNGTSVLQTLSMNIPTIIFWDPKFWELTDDAHRIFLQLEKNKIFHRSAESAVEFLNKVYDNIDDWWLSDEVQESVDTFCSNYAKKIDISDIVSLIKKI